MVQCGREGDGSAVTGLAEPGAVELYRPIGEGRPPCRPQRIPPFFKHGGSEGTCASPVPGGRRPEVSDLGYNRSKAAHILKRGSKLLGGKVCRAVGRKPDPHGKSALWWGGLHARQGWNLKPTDHVRPGDSVFAAVSVAGDATGSAAPAGAGAASDHEC